MTVLVRFQLKFLNNRSKVYCISYQVSSTGFNLETANSREIVDAAHGELVRHTDFTSCHQPGPLSSHQMSFLRSLIFGHHQDSISSQQK